ncbi:hypothetical protein P7M17_10740 [Vibrio parahaemolyticus]|nr:hypothetical protein [Vibrio parahaemolyticus]MDG2756054.1 hypothetical protein [Vibrio parahaemolyticus]
MKELIMEKVTKSLIQRIEDEGRVHINDVSDDMQEEAKSLLDLGKIEIRKFDSDIYATAYDIAQPYFCFKKKKSLTID